MCIIVINFLTVSYLQTSVLVPTHRGGGGGGGGGGVIGRKGHMIAWNDHMIAWTVGRGHMNTFCIIYNIAEPGCVTHICLHIPSALVRNRIAQ